MTEHIAQPSEEQGGDAPRPVRRRVNLPRGQIPHDPGAWFGLGDFVKLLRTAFIRNADAEGEASDPVPQAVDPSAKKQRVQNLRRRRGTSRHGCSEGANANKSSLNGNVGSTKSVRKRGVRSTG